METDRIITGELRGYLEAAWGPAKLDTSRTGDDYTGNSSNVVTARRGSAKPRTHFSDAFVLYFSA
jgi:hypothetical protein